MDREDLEEAKEHRVRHNLCSKTCRQGKQLPQRTLLFLNDSIGSVGN